MSTENTTENNKLLAEFMGFEIKSDRVLIPKIYHAESSPFSLLKWIDDFREADNLPPNSLNNLHFHKDWNWLIEVVKKIESLHVANRVFIANQTIITIHDKSINESKVFIGQQQFANLPQNKIENTYNACIEFVKWYNKNK